MPTKFTCTLAEIKELVDAAAVGRRFSMSTDVVHKRRIEGKIPCVEVSSKVIRFSIPQVAEALGMVVVEEAK